MPYEGIKRPFVQTAGGHACVLSMRAANVNSVLLSVADMIRKNQRVVFDLDGSYVEHKTTGERISIEWDGHNPIIEMQVLDPEPEDKPTTHLCDFDDDNTDKAIAQDFPWQAQIP